MSLLRYTWVQKTSGEFFSLVENFLHFIGMTKEQSVGTVRTLLQDFPFNIFIIVVTERKTNELIGFIISQTAMDADTIVIMQLWLKGDHRSAGIVPRLLDFTKKWAETGKRKYIRFIVKESDLELFKGVGFRVDAFNLIMGLELEDEILFEDSAKEDDDAASQDTKRIEVQSSAQTNSTEVKLHDGGSEFTVDKLLAQGEEGKSSSPNDNG